MDTPVRVHSIPYSTNVERVALACGIKGIEVEWVEHDPADRSAVVALSGQELVPVAEIGPEVVCDSIRIIERLESLAPRPALYPDDPGRRAVAEIFIEWFNQVWKVPPNALDARQPPADADALRSMVVAWTGRFEGLLASSDYLLGRAPEIADVCAYPFLRYAVDEPAAGDEERFHAILHELLAPGDHPALDAWVARMATLPQA